MDKTLLISEIFPPINGGSGRWFWELYSRLPQSEYVIAAGDSDKANAFDLEHNLNLQRLDLSSESWGIASKTGLRFYWKTFRALRKIIKKQNVTSIHCGRCLPEGVIGLILSKWFRIPFITYIHGEDIETALLSRELSILVSLVLRSADGLICNSHNTATLVAKKWGIQNDKIEVLHPGVDTKHFTPAPFSSETKRELNWQDRTVILTVGRLQKRKGHDKMIQAMPEIIKSVPNALYSIIGDGFEQTRLHELVDILDLKNFVQFLGEPNDDLLIKAYQQCDLFILPNRTEGSDIEGFGMVLVEAQSCGKPVIAGNSGGTKETMVTHQTGYIIDCTDPKRIAKKVTELLADRDQLSSMGLAARAHVKKELDWQAHKNKAIDIFNQRTNKH